MPGPDVSLMTVSYNVRDVLRETLCAARAGREGLPSEHWVIDNGSRDGSAEMVSREFPEVRLLVSPENVGPGRARNQVIPRLDGRYVLNLDSDVTIHPDTIAGLVEYMDAHPEVGAAGCRLLNPDGTWQRSAFHAPQLGAAAWRRARALAGGRREDFGQAKEPVEAGWLKGALCIYRKSALEQVGGFDPRFFIYYEEVDLHLRMRRRGWRLVYLPGPTATHIEGRSMDENFAECQFERETNELQFIRKHFPRPFYWGARARTVARSLYYSRWCPPGRLSRTFWGKPPDQLRQIYADVLRATLPFRPLPLHPVPEPAGIDQDPGNGRRVAF